jgi:uncharacterized protein (DUF2225 family)
MGVAFLINISSIKNISRVKKCPLGTVITGEGVHNLMFAVVKGEVGVYTRYRKPDAALVQTLGSGDLYADPGLLKNKPAAYTTVSLGDAIIIPIEKRTAIEFIQDEPALTFELMKELFLRLEPAYSPQASSPHHDKGDMPLKTKKTAETERRTQEQSYTDSSGAGVDTVADGTAAVHTHAVHTNTVRANTVRADADVTPPDPAQTPSVSLRISGLFPEGHGAYELPLKEQNTAILMSKTHLCPICRSSFTAQTIRPSKLVVAATDPDLRNHYKGIEPLYYEVLTCPACLYSALPDQFGSPEKSKPDIMKALEPLKGSVGISLGSEKTTDSVFAGYYLALACAPIAFTKYQLTQAKLQYKLSRVYGDAGDAEMENRTSLKALENYLYAYARIGIPPSQEQQICILIGELYLKQNDLKNAIGFFNRARSGGSPVLQKHAEDRCYEIREAAKK